MQSCEDYCRKARHELSLFRFLSETDTVTLACYFDCLSVRQGEFLFQEGDACTYLAFVAKGRLQLKKATDIPGKDVIVGIYGKSAVVGELCMFDDNLRAVSAVAMEDTTLVRLGRENLDRLVDDHPRLGAELLKGVLLAISLRLRSSFERLSVVF